MTPPIGRSLTCYLGVQGELRRPSLDSSSLVALMPEGQAQAIAHHSHKLNAQLRLSKGLITQRPTQPGSQQVRWPRRRQSSLPRRGWTQGKFL